MNINLFLFYLLVVLPVSLFVVYSIIGYVFSNKTTTPSISRDMLIFNSYPGIDYSTFDNTQKIFTFGTFIYPVILTGMLFFVDNNSIFDNAYVDLVINDNNNQIFNKQITDFTKSITETKIDNIIVPKDAKLILIINGDNIKLFKSSISFTILPYTEPITTTIQPIQTTTIPFETTMETTMMPTTMYPMETTTMQPTTMMSTTMQPTTMMPTTMYPMTIQPTTMMPTTMQPMENTMMPTTMQPTTMMPTTMYPMTTMFPTCILSNIVYNKIINPTNIQMEDYMKKYINMLNVKEDLKMYNMFLNNKEINNNCNLMSETTYKYTIGGGIILYDMDDRFNHDRDDERQLILMNSSYVNNINYYNIQNIIIDNLILNVTCRNDSAYDWIKSYIYYSINYIGTTIAFPPIGITTRQPNIVV